MNTKAEFKGQRVSDKMWIYGYYIYKNWEGGDNKHYIISFNNGIEFEVIPETVGQFTGLKDASKEKVKLYDKDIISDANGFKKVIYWEEEKARFCVKNIIALKYENTQYINQGISQEYICELGFVKVGNIFDNPELLKLN